MIVVLILVLVVACVWGTVVAITAKENKYYGYWDENVNYFDDPSYDYDESEDKEDK